MSRFLVNLARRGAGLEGPVPMRPPFTPVFATDAGERQQPSPGSSPPDSRESFLPPVDHANVPTAASPPSRTSSPPSPPPPPSADLLPSPSGAPTLQPAIEVEATGSRPVQPPPVPEPRPAPTTIPSPSEIALPPVAPKVAAPHTAPVEPERHIPPAPSVEPVAFSPPPQQPATPPATLETPSSPPSPLTLARSPMRREDVKEIARAPAEQPRPEPPAPSPRERKVVVVEPTPVSGPPAERHIPPGQAASPELPRPVQVRIGTVEVSAATPQPASPPQAPAQPPPPAPQGFDAYADIRSYTTWETDRG
jgi:hypothetical protein